MKFLILLRSLSALEKNKSWHDIYLGIKKDILSGIYKPGQELPSTPELLELYGGSRGTLQKAVTHLVQEGLIITFGKSFKKRIVSPSRKRSVRTGGFRADSSSKDKVKVEIMELNIISDATLLPDNVISLMDPPILVYKTRQWKYDLPVALSYSYIPHILPINELKNLLSTPSTSLYNTMSYFGFTPYRCEEHLIATHPTENEKELLFNPSLVVLIDRKVFDQNNHIIELCFLKDRADCYKFQYQFKLEV